MENTYIVHKFKVWLKTKEDKIEPTEYKFLQDLAYKRTPLKFCTYQLTKAAAQNMLVITYYNEHNELISRKIEYL